MLYKHQVIFQVWNSGTVKKSPSQENLSFLYYFDIQGVNVRHNWKPFCDA